MKKKNVDWISHECLPLRLFCLLGECFAFLFPVRKMSEHSLTHIPAGPMMRLSCLLSNVKVSDRISVQMCTLIIICACHICEQLKMRQFSFTNALYMFSMCFFFFWTHCTALLTACEPISCWVDCMLLLKASVRRAYRVRQYHPDSSFACLIL